MAEETKQEGSALDNLQEQYTRFEQYVLENRQTVSYVVGGVLVVAIIITGWFKWYVPKKEREAMAQIFMAQKYFAADSLNLALNGDRTSAGFLKVAKEYGFTHTGNLAHYYAGNILLRQGKFQDAIEQLQKFNDDDKIVSTQALGLIGDAYSELGKMDDAVDYYKKAAYKNENDALSPYYLNKAALAYYVTKKYKESRGLFDEIKKKYPDSQESRNADRYLSALDVLGS